MTNYPNIEAIANGTISGEFRDWVRVKPEAMAILAELKRLEGLILNWYSNHGGEYPLKAEARRIRTQREENK